MKRVGIKQWAQKTFRDGTSSSIIFSRIYIGLFTFFLIQLISYWLKGYLEETTRIYDFYNTNLNVLTSVTIPLFIDQKLIKHLDDRSLYVWILIYSYISFAFLYFSPKRIEEVLHFRRQQ